jgi:hypothetical protein
VSGQGQQKGKKAIIPVFVGAITVLVEAKPSHTVSCGPAQIPWSACLAQPFSDGTTLCTGCAANTMTATEFEKL